MEWGFTPFTYIFQDYFEPVDGFLEFDRSFVQISVDGEPKEMSDVWPVLQGMVKFDDSIELLMGVEAFELLTFGCNSKSLEEELGMSRNTVKTHSQQLRETWCFNPPRTTLCNRGQKAIVFGEA